MNNLTIYAALYVLLLFGANRVLKSENVLLNGRKSEPFFFAAAVLLVTAFKIWLSPQFYGHSSDMSLFTAWADLGRYESVTEFYGETGANYYVDYPPLYLYVLTIIGRFCGRFHITYGTDLYIALIKLVPILADAATVLLVYRIASRETTPRQANILGLLMLVNPAYVLNSVFWGQIDGLYTLIIFWLLYAVYRKRYMQGVLAFTVGMLTKPQMLIFLPLLGFCALFDVITEMKEEKKIITLLHCLAGLGLSAVVVFLSAVPIFGLDFPRFFSLYTDAAGQYPYASLNATNFFGAFGLNWEDVTLTFLGISYKSWGFIGIILTSLAVGGGVLFSKNRSAVFMLGGFTVISIYMTAHMMHERYLFPLILILLITYIITKDKRMLFAFGATSVISFLQTGLVLLDNEEIITFSEGAFIAVSWVHIALYVYLAAIWFRMIIWDERKHAEALPPKILCIKPPKQSVRYTRKDVFIMLVLTLVYGVSAFWHLGSLKAPESGWFPTEPQESVILDFGEEQMFHRVNFFLGWIDRRDSDSEVERNLAVSFGGNADITGGTELVFGDETELTVDSVFDWTGFYADEAGRYLKISVDEGNFYMEEIACYDENQRLLLPKAVYQGNDTAQALFDEPDTALYEYTWYDGTYFDEVYHPRTAYEYIHGMWPYENTHPPLGKLIIGLGIMLFGMNPFGWRFFGTLCGVLMVPAVYMLAKQLLKTTKWAFFACAIFTFDFMHLAQTRLATIDSYTAFFVMLMYGFMYRFIRLNFYQTGVKKTLLPLFLSGLFFGIGIAVKWQGVYAGIGLCVMFFATLFRRFSEYRAAKDGRLVGDSEKVIRTFVPNTVKTLLAAVLFFVIIPLAIYFASYLPIILSDCADISY
ncbi:MAG: phospholipid carrier-dependent glycosyltransferase, partial [Clostridia bacterium]|nr:phospholipid carrier-dependent glycosyltransferase [Clostridia bacterium]